MAVVIVFIVFFTNIFNLSCGSSFKWRRVQTMDNKSVPGSFLVIPALQYRTLCAQMCSMHSNCYSFFYDASNILCYLHDDVYTTSATSKPGTRYYVSDNKVPSTTTATTEGTTEALITTEQLTTTVATTTIPTTTTSQPTTTIPTTTATTCPSNFVSASGYCFFVSTTKKSWTSARLDCQAYTNGDLLVIDSGTKQQFFNTYMKNNGHMQTYHFGVHHAYSNGNFQYVDGRTQATAPYTYWGTGEPNNMDGPDLCCFLNWKYSQTQLRWNDGSCSFVDYFICEVR